PRVSPANVAPKYSAIASGELEDTKRPHIAVHHRRKSDDHDYGSTDMRRSIGPVRVLAAGLTCAGLVAIGLVATIDPAAGRAPPTAPQSSRQGSPPPGMPAVPPR